MLDSTVAKTGVVSVALLLVAASAAPTGAQTGPSKSGLNPAGVSPGSTLTGTYQSYLWFSSSDGRVQVCAAKQGSGTPAVDCSPVIQT